MTELQKAMEDVLLLEIFSGEYELIKKPTTKRGFIYKENVTDYNVVIKQCLADKVDTLDEAISTLRDLGMVHRCWRDVCFENENEDKSVVEKSFNIIINEWKKALNVALHTEGCSVVIDNTDHIKKILQEGYFDKSLIERLRDEDKMQTKWEYATLSEKEATNIVLYQIMRLVADRNVAKLKDDYPRWRACHEAISNWVVILRGLI